MAVDAQIVELNEVASLQAGYPFRTTVGQAANGDVLVVQMKDVDVDAGVQWANTVRTRLAGRKQPDWIQDGDILFAAKGARFYAVCALAPPGRAVCVPAFFHLRVRAGAQVDPQFLVWQINQPPCQRQLLQAAEGSSQLSLRRPVLERLTLSIPAFDEQRRIAALAELAQLERRALQRLISNREQQLQAIAEDLSAPASKTRMQDKK
ncbi:MAG: restriction endonuclease subunit S [Burkholderiales bacterium]|nr:restriction endonuclease subunit S [Burkholderiales bacterium]